MTNRERFIKTLKCEPIGGQVPTFELVFYLTMESLGKVHPLHRKYEQWDQMSLNERKLHLNDMAQVYIDVAKKYGHSAILQVMVHVGAHVRVGGVEGGLPRAGRVWGKPNQ